MTAGTLAGVINPLAVAALVKHQVLTLTQCPAVTSSSLHVSYHCCYFVTLWLADILFDLLSDVQCQAKKYPLKLFALF